jgi:protein-disulfide isomerase
MKRKSLFITAAVALLAAFVIGTLVYQGGKADAAKALERQALLVRDYAPTKGPTEAKVHIVEFLDPACGTCRDFYPLVKQLMDEHRGKIKLTVRYAPFHPNSDYVVKVIEAARKQRKYWETLEALFASQQAWSPNHRPDPALIWSYLGGVGLDLDRLRQDALAPGIAQNLAQDIADGKALNVSATPEFFVNGKPLPSFGYEQLNTLVKDALKAAYP